MIHTIAGLGFVAALLFALLGLAVFMWNLRVPRVLRNILWALPVAPLVMVACFAIVVVTYPIGA